MATPLDSGAGFLVSFKPIFVWLFVFALVYAILRKIPLFGKGNDSGLVRLHGLIAFVIATLFILTPGLTEVVSTAAPWVMILVMVIVFILFIFLFAGVESGKIVENVFMESTYIWIIVLTVLAIFGFALSQVYGEAVQGVTGAQGEEGPLFDIAKILFSPKLLGMLLILAIASQTIRLVVK